MKSKSLIALLFLALIVCSSAIQVREKTDFARRHRRHFRHNSHRRNKLRDVPKEMKADLWGAIKRIFNKDDFRFTLGATLSLLGKINFPYSVSIFFNQSDDPEKSGWDYEFSPGNKKDVDGALQKIKSEKKSDYDAILKKYTDSETIANMIVNAAESTAKAFILDTLTTAAKAVLVAIFPPLGPIFAIYALINSSGVYLTKDEEAAKAGKVDIYKLGYTYTLTVLTGVKVKLFVEMTLNFKELKAVLNVYKQKVIDWINKQYDKLPQGVKDVVKAAGDLAKAVQKDIEDFVSVLSETYLKAKKLLVATLKDLIDKVKDTEIGQWVLKLASGLAKQAEAFVQEAQKFWNNFKSKAAAIADKVVALVKDAYNTAKDWIGGMASAIGGFFKSIFSHRRFNYRKLFIRANRRYFRLARRNRNYRGKY